MEFYLINFILLFNFKRQIEIKLYLFENNSESNSSLIISGNNPKIINKGILKKLIF